MSKPAWIHAIRMPDEEVCGKGHDMTGANGLVLSDGELKMCRACRGIGNRSYGSEWNNGRLQYFVFVPDHPRSRADGFYARARLVMEQKIGRLLDPEERVLHYPDESPGNDDPENLMLLNSAHEMAKFRSEKYQEKKERLGGGWAALTTAQRAYQEERAEETRLARDWARKEAARERSNKNLRRGSGK